MHRIRTIVSCLCCTFVHWKKAFEIIITVYPEEAAVRNSLTGLNRVTQLNTAHDEVLGRSLFSVLAKKHAFVIIWYVNTQLTTITIIKRFPENYSNNKFWNSHKLFTVGNGKCLELQTNLAWLHIHCKYLFLFYITALEFTNANPTSLKPLLLANIPLFVLSIFPPKAETGAEKRSRQHIKISTLIFGTYISTET